MFRSFSVKLFTRCASRRAARFVASFAAVLLVFGQTALAPVQAAQATVEKGKKAPKPRRVLRPRTGSLEYRLSWGLASIKADRAYARGLDGRGVTVAMIDTGLDVGSLQLFGSVSPASVDLISNRSGNTPPSEHGRETAQLLAAALDGQGTLGVAYGANLLSIRIDVEGSCRTQCYAYGRDLARGINYALDHGARIIGVPMVGKQRLRTIEPALERAVALGAVIVMAAGNDGAPDASWPARYAADPRFRDAIIIAGASDMQGEVAAWSNKAGPSGDRYLAAPGENLFVDCNTRTCRLVSGTSYSVSYVAGALSVIIAARSDLTAQQAGKLLLTSAADRGARGIDQVTGTGLLDLGRAVTLARRLERRAAQSS
jgi:subtilisin family serine protease